MPGTQNQPESSPGENHQKLSSKRNEVILGKDILLKNRKNKPRPAEGMGFAFFRHYLQYSITIIKVKLQAMRK